MKKKIIVAICGASGSIYGVTLLRELLSRPVEVHVIISSDGNQVMTHELGYQNDLLEMIKTLFELDVHPDAQLIQHDINSFFSSPASGSFKHQGMVIAPCTMKTLAAVSAGLADNLITRAADICLKEKRPLIIAPRETPFSTIHLENMLRLSNAGATILPANPGFYFGPKTILDLVEFIVGRILDQFGFSHNLTGEWSSETEV